MVRTRRHGLARVNVPGAKSRYHHHCPDGTLRPSYKNDNVDVRPTKEYSKKSSSSSSDDDTDDDETKTKASPKNQVLAATQAPSRKLLI
jgi:hypothetical protein